MKNNRRKFLQISGTLAAGSLLLPSIGCNSTTKNTKTNSSDASGMDKTPAGSIDEFGIQLYTLRDDIPKDPKGVLKQLGEFGYKQIEGYEGDQGLWWDMGHMDFKKYLDCLLYTSPSPRDQRGSRMPSSA